MKILVAVAVGGMLGAVGRYILSLYTLRLFGDGFPWGTFAVNFLGSVAMGVLFETLTSRWQIGPELRNLITVGFLGSFTTFSTFSLEVVQLFERGLLITGLFYVVASVVLCVLGLFVGLSLMRAVPI